MTQEAVYSYFLVNKSKNLGFRKISLFMHEEGVELGLESSFLRLQ